MLENVEGHFLSMLVCGLKPAYVAWTYAYAGLFLRFCVHRLWPAYIGSYLHTWVWT